MKQLSLEHVTAPALTAAVAVAAALSARSRPGRWERRFARALAALLGLNVGDHEPLVSRCAQGA